MNLLTFFRWLDGQPNVATWLAWGAFLFATSIAVLPVFSRSDDRADSRASHPAIYAIALLAMFTAFRWPTWFAPAMLNPDEAQMIAGAITLEHFPVFWKYVDGTTHGPLNDIALFAAPMLGLSLNYLGARVVTALLQAGALMCVWRAVRYCAPEWVARLSILPAAVYWCCAGLFDIVQYSSEQVPLFLIAAAGWPLARAVVEAPGSRPRLAAFGAGILLAAVPFAKLQAVPLAIVVGVLGCSALAWQRRWLVLFWLCGGVAVLLTAFVIYLFATGIGPEFWEVYIRRNLLYAQKQPIPLGRMLAGFRTYAGIADGLIPILAGTMATALVGLIAAWRIRTLHAATVRWCLAAWVIGAAALYSVIAPGRENIHYLHLLVAPMAFLGACHLAAISHGWSSLSKVPGAPSLSLPILSVIALLIAPWATGGNRATSYLGHWDDHRAQAVAPAAREIRTAAKPGDTLAMWGWMPSLYVETGLPQATREAHTERQIEGTPESIAFYRRRFLADLQRMQPTWFVDAVGDGNFAYNNRRVCGHEIFPDLATVVTRDYQLWRDIDGFRIYRRRSPTNSAGTSSINERTAKSDGVLVHALRSLDPGKN